MALSILLKHIYNNSSDDVIRRGKKIFLTSGVQLMHRDEISNQLTFRVRNDIYRNYYNVHIARWDDEKTINVRCACPYNMGEVCRHEAAALFHLNDMVQQKAFDNTETSFNQKHTMVRMHNIDLRSLRLFTSPRLFEEANIIAKANQVTMLSGQNEIVEGEINEDGTLHKIILKRNMDKSFDTSCTCNESTYALCKHKTALFVQLLNNFGETYFDTIRNWDMQKNKLLSLYGYSLQDDLTGKFEFFYTDGKPFLRVLDTSIKKVDVRTTTKIEVPTMMEKKIVTATDFTKRLGVVLNLNEPDFPYFNFELIEGEIDEENIQFVGTVSKVDTTKYVVADNYPEEDRHIINDVRKMQKQEVNKYLAKNSPFGDMWENITTSQQDWTDDNKQIFFDYMQPKIQKILASLSYKNPLYLLPNGKSFKTTHLQKISCGQQALTPKIKISKTAKEIKIDISLEADDKKYSYTKNIISSPLLFIYNDTMMTLNDKKSVWGLEEIISKKPSDNKDWELYLENVLLPHSKFINIEFDKKLYELNENCLPEIAVMLMEQGSYFVLKPYFIYKNNKVEWNNEINISSQYDGKIVQIKRNKEIEHEFLEKLKTLHENIKPSSQGNQFLINSKFALKDNWLYLFFEKMKEWNITLLGYENLKKFKFKKLKPATKIQVASNIDWFDTEIELDFGGEIASLKDIQKSIQSNQNYVELADGTLGLLPEEWLKKYSLLFKMAQVEGKKLRLNKINFNVIDDLHDEISDTEILEELQEKKKQLLEINLQDFDGKPLPVDLKADLRPYQKSGFHWLSYLENVGWGGLLADDMGLGKTIQALTGLQGYKEKHGKLHALIVCPTTLLFNWENEIKKFTPNLTYLIHHTANRTSKIDELKKYDIIISTYGTLRSDIEMLLKIKWDYAVLDESQAIKNPNAKVSKATYLIEAKNRVALSGTPMQNNTFDIYSQMHFLNPGMLGNKEFFKENFAVPIDKFQEQSAKDHLRKLIYPFLLRRTKEQVAKDLPEKTEITLFCEMETKQRKIYDEHRLMYRSKILGEIDSLGIGKSQFSILQGLMRLRQICDSPAIVNLPEKMENHSIKLEELVRELEENTGNHKVLIFSQFLGMLGLIREKLKEKEIDFEYFDGSYSSVQREKAIQHFQNDDNCRVFLISLKAGGMGLNLTAADYVYIMDPWWNPAVEQQAIDRTHRIGQTKNIFAYRFICKDSVEEKIMTLKEKKNSLVKDIISDDTAFVKKLSREDIDYLFS